MKTKTIFRKPRVIITALVLAVLVALAAVVVVLAQDKATFKGVSVATDGDINIRFHYTGIQDGVTTARYTVSDGGLVVSDPDARLTLVSTGDGEGYFEVPLAAAQMGCDVEVVPLDENGNDACSGNNVKSFSVREYAELVFADEAHSSYYSALKAILNYGAYATEYFKDDVVNTVVVNEGLFSRLTNPIVGMQKKLTAGAAPKPVVAEAYASDFSDVELVINLDSTIGLRLYYTYTGDGAVSGTPVEGEANRYYKYVANIATTLYEQDYSAYLSVNVNGETAITVSDATVMNCLKALVSGAETKDLALAMYNYYYWTATTPSQEGCAHGAFHYEAVTLGATSSKATCTFCGLQTSIAVPDSVNYFSAPGQVTNQWNTGNAQGNSGTATGTIVSDADGIYQHIGLYQSAALTFDSTSGNRGIAADETIFGGAGNYIVFKFKMTGERMACLRLNNNLSTITKGADYSMGQYGAEPENNYGNDLNWRTNPQNGWITMVIDINAFNASSTLKSGLNSFYPTAKELADAGMENAVTSVGAGLFFHGGSQTDPNYIDVQYFAIVDDWAEVAELLGEETQVTYTRWRNTTADKTRFANGWCLDDGHTVVTKEVSDRVGSSDANVCYTVDVETYCSYCGKSISVANTTVKHNITLTTGTSNGNTVHTYSCSNGCGTLDERVVGTGVNYYSTHSGR